MKILKTYLPLIIGAVILVSANSERFKTPYLYIFGIVLMMFGLYNISKTVRSKVNNYDSEED